MSVQAMSWVIEKSVNKGSAFVVLLMIANHAHADGTGSYPSFETLAFEARITVRQVTNLIPVLERSGELYVDRGRGPHGTNLYTLRMDQLKLRMEKISNGKWPPRISNEPSLTVSKEPCSRNPLALVGKGPELTTGRVNPEAVLRAKARAKSA